jgi:hypothetical protein
VTGAAAFAGAESMASSDHDLDMAFATMVQQQIGALMVLGDIGFFSSRDDRIAALAARIAGAISSHPILPHQGRDFRSNSKPTKRVPWTVFALTYEAMK